MTYPATNSKEASELLIDVSNQMHEIVNEDATTEVMTESGLVPSVRKALADTFLFQDPIAWNQGSDETAFNQLRTFDGNIYWAPTATILNPIPMGSTPVGDSNWKLAPVDVSREWTLDEITTSQEDLIDGSIFKGSNGDFAQNGDTIPTGKDYIRILVNGSYRIVRPYTEVTLPLTIVSLPLLGNGFSGYDLVTDQGTVEFITKDTFELRSTGQASGWGASELLQDSAPNFVRAHEDFGSLVLPERKSYFCSSLPDLPTLVIRGVNSKIRFNQKLIERSFDKLDIEGVEFDAENSDVTRCIRALKNSNVRLRKVNGLNVRSTTFCYFLNFSTEGSYLDIDDCYNESLHATENGVVGDLNGSCRFILVSDDPATPVTNPTSGSITNIKGKDLQPREDGDMVHITSASDRKFEITLDQIHGVDIAKRVVKVQVNGVDVGVATAKTENLTEAMFSIVSHYGEFGTVKLVSGEGWFSNGCDTQYGSTVVDTVSCKNTGSAGSQSSAFKASGGCVAKLVNGEGFEHIASAYISLETDAIVDIGETMGSSTGIPVFGRCAVDVNEFKLGKSRGKSTGAFQPVRITQLGGSGSKFKKAEVSDIDVNSTTFNVVDIRYCDEFRYSDITGDSTGSVLAVNGGSVYGKNAVSKGGTRAVLLTSVDEAVIEGSRGALTEQIRTQGCNNVVALNTVTNTGIPAVADEFSNPSTNSQEIQTITLV